MIMKKSSLGKKFYLPKHTVANSQNGIAAFNSQNDIAAYQLFRCYYI